MKIRLTAKTPFERARGLMYSQPLTQDEIAVFIFPKETTAGFWNKNVSYPIRIVFFDSNFNVVGMKSMKADQAKLITSLEPYKYAVEMSDTDSDPFTLINIKNYLKKQYGNKV